MLMPRVLRTRKINFLANMAPCVGELQNKVMIGNCMLRLRAFKNQENVLKYLNCGGRGGITQA